MISVTAGILLGLITAAKPALRFGTRLKIQSRGITYRAKVILPAPYRFKAILMKCQQKVFILRYYPQNILLSRPRCF